MTDDSGLTGPATRRTLLAGAGAVGAAVVLAACGDDEPSGSGSTAPTAGGPVNADGGVIRTSDVPVGGGVILANQQVVVTQPSPGVFKGFSPFCTHQKCPVSKIDSGVIICTCHNSRFSIEDGSVRGGPATEPLPAKDIAVDGDQIRLS